MRLCEGHIINNQCIIEGRGSAKHACVTECVLYAALVQLLGLNLRGFRLLINWFVIIPINLECATSREEVLDRFKLMMHCVWCKAPSTFISVFLMI
jgi:hypothetical protein